MVQKKAAKKTKTTKQGALKRAAKVLRKPARKPAKKARRQPATLAEAMVPSSRRGRVEPVKKLARGANVPAGTLAEELPDAFGNG